MAVPGSDVGVGVEVGVAAGPGKHPVNGTLTRPLPDVSVLATSVPFTVALFITDLAFDDPALREQAVVGVLTGSLLAAALGWGVFHFLGERGGVCAPPGEDTDPVPTLPSRPWYEPAR